MTKNVNELSSLDWVRKLPEWISVRAGMVDGWDEPLVALWSEKHQLHVTFLLQPDIERILTPAINNLAGAVFEKLHPGELLKLPTRMAKALSTSGVVDPEDQALWDEYKSLQVWPTPEPVASLAAR